MNAERRQGLPIDRMRPKYFDLILGAFVVVVVLSNVVAASKVTDVRGIVFGSSAIFFPLSYVIGDVVAEVYGYRFARRLVWAGTAAMLFTAATTSVVLALPSAASWHDQAAFEAVFLLSPRIACASIAAFWVGELLNAVVLVKMKVSARENLASRGLTPDARGLWKRTIASTAVGQAADCIIFFPIAFLGVWPTSVLLNVLASNYLIKVLWEVICTPLTYRVVGLVKRHERIDHYDIDTNFSPFKLDITDEEAR